MRSLRSSESPFRLLKVSLIDCREGEERQLDNTTNLAMAAPDIPTCSGQSTTNLQASIDVIFLVIVKLGEFLGNVCKLVNAASLCLYISL